MNSTPEPLFYSQGRAIVKYGINGNSLKLSSLSDFYAPVDSTGLAIKFVVEGCERYMINKQPYAVQAGSYLLLNGEKDAKVEIESKKTVKGICIHIADTLIADAAASLIRPDTAYADPELATFLSTDLFLENQYQAMHTLLGSKLQQIGKDVQRNILSHDDINTGMFFELAEKLIADQAVVFKQLQSIPTIKPATRRDLCRRLIRGREYIDANYTLPLTIEQVAQEAAMSEYHFFRLFKKVFGTSPHQYIMSKRLHAAKLLLTGGQTVSAAALDCGFADIFTFSKAFKKHFGVAPSAHSHIK